MKTQEYWNKRRLALIVGLCSLIASIGLFGTGRTVTAHAYPVKSEPADGDVLAAPPQSIMIWFDEKPALEHSEIAVFDANFNQVDRKDSHLAPQDDRQLIVDLPANLPAGTYTVRWSALSATDGHSATGTFVFAVGGPIDSAIASAAAAQSTSTPIDPAQALIAWLNVLALTTLAGAVLTGLLVLRPAVSADRFPTTRLQWLIYGVAVLAIVGAIGDLFVRQTQSYDLGTVLRDKLWLQALLTTRYGALWWLRFGMITGLLAWAAFWPVNGARSTLGWLIGAALTLGLLTIQSLSSHSAASAILTGLSTAIDWLHLVSASAWIGGVLILSLTLRRFVPSERRDVLVRFSALATISVVVITLTGLYSAGLHLYQIQDLWQSDYGRWLLFKLALVALLLLLGLQNNLALRKPESHPHKNAIRVQQRVLLESGLGIGVLFAVGFLTSAAPPQPPLVTADRTLTQFKTESNLTAALRISPNVPGKNTYTVRVTQRATGAGSGSTTDQPLTTLAQARIQFILPARDLHTNWVTLTPDAAGAYVGSSLDLSAIGDWQAVVDVRPDPQADDVRFVVPWAINSAQIGIDPTQPRPANLVALGLLVAVAVIMGWPRLMNALRKRTAVRVEYAVIGLLIVLTIPVVISMFIGSLTHGVGTTAVNPILPDTTSIIKGQALYQQVCAGCHGIQGLGDGPNASTLAVPPANLRIHIGLHSDADLYTIISNGFGAMSPAGAGLTPDDHWNLINYLRTLQADSTAP
ncbi:MAG: copper resistance protein CopC [Aggregatilineales bacterium]